MFARSDDVNLAYSAALTVVNLTQPDQSTMVVKVSGGHNLLALQPSACADILTTWIQNWAGGGAGGAAGSTQISLTAPVDQAVGPTKQFPRRFHAVLQHRLSAAEHVLLALPFAECDGAAVAVLSPAATSIRLTRRHRRRSISNTPALSRFYVRLATESHNCWATTPGGPVDCAGSAARMLSAIQAFANGVAVTPVDPSLVVSRALTLYAGTVASGNNRFDGDIIARWMFKEGTAPRPSIPAAWIPPST